MLQDEAIKFARSATGVRQVLAACWSSLAILTQEQASKAQFKERPAPGGGIHFLVIERGTGRDLVGGFYVQKASAADRKRYAVDMLTEAWEVLAREAQEAAQEAEEEAAIAAEEAAAEEEAERQKEAEREERKFYAGVERGLDPAFSSWADAWNL